MNFYIATMPRCGSAWLANLLTRDGVMAHHEVLRKTYSSGLPVAAAWDEGYRHEGAVGCDLALWPQAVPEDAALVVVRRDLESCYRSVVGFNRRNMRSSPTVDRSLVEACLEGIEELSERARLVVDFRALFSTGSVLDILTELGLPGLDPAVLLQALSLNVQITGKVPFYDSSEDFVNLLTRRLRLTHD